MACKVVGKMCYVAGEVLPVHIDLTDFTERRWDKVAAAGIYADGDVVRPTPGKRTGYEYLATAGGQVGVAEPAWPTTLGETVQDGSVTWECQDISNDSLVKVVETGSDGPSWDGDGFEIADESVVNTQGRQAVRCFIHEPSDGVDAGKHTVTAVVTFDDGHVETFGVEVKA